MEENTHYNAQAKNKTKKRQTLIHKNYTENWKLSNAKPSKGWTQVHISTTINTTLSEQFQILMKQSQKWAKMLSLTLKYMNAELPGLLQTR
jgi:hypothetical protein